MSQADLSRELRNLLLEQIHSYEQLDAAVFLFRLPDRRATTDQLSTELKLSREAARDALDHLAGCGMLGVSSVESPTHHYELQPQFEPLIEELERFYEENRLELMSIMTANAIERMRTGALRAFANAFVLGKKRDDG
jgi:hypothetical protein